MELLLFTMSIFVYFYICYFFARLYFSRKRFKKEVSKNKLAKIITEYVFFLTFISLEIPFAFFFPAWISNKLIVTQNNPINTILLIFFGAIVLVISLSLGYRRAKKLRAV